MVLLAACTKANLHVEVKDLPSLSKLSISSITPAEALTSGGITVTLKGSGFLAGAAVTLGGLDCAHVQVVSTTELTCLVPQNSAGSVDVSVTNPSGTQSSGLGGATLTSGFTYRGLTVEHAYPLNGANWNDYVKSSGGQVYAQADQACLGLETGYYGEACVHAGEILKVKAFGYSSCSGLSLNDSLSAFNWTCDASTGSATFYSTGLKPGVGLSSLITASAWKNNSANLFLNSSLLLSSAESPWWTNAVTPAPDSSAVTQVLSTSGVIYTVSGAKTGQQGYNILGSKIGFVILPGASLSSDASGPNSPCTGPNLSQYCIVSAQNANHVWIEGGNVFTQMIYYSYNFFFYNVNYSRIHGIHLSKSYDFGFRLTNSNSNLFSSIDYQTNPMAASDTYAMYLENSMYNRIEGLTVQNSPWAVGVYLVGSAYNRIKNLNATSILNGITLSSGSNHNDLSDIKISGLNKTGSSATGIVFDGSSFNRALNLRVSATYRGLSVLNASNSNSFYKLNLSNTNSDGLYVNLSDDNRFTSLLLSHSGDQGLNVQSSLRNTFAFVTAINNLVHPAAFTASNQTSVMNFLAFNNGNSSSAFNNGSLLVSNSGLGQFSQMALAGAYSGVSLQLVNSTDSVFSGNLLIGASGSGKCSVSGTNPGLTSACSNQGLSSANLSTLNLDLSASFVGALSSTDSVNASNASGSALYSAITDWLNFTNFFRVFGTSGLIPSGTVSGVCLNSQTCNIWDYRLKTTDLSVLNKTFDGLSANEALASGMNCPAGLSGNSIFSDLNQTPSTFLLNAMELENSGGNNNGLCETGETCVYAPNFGVYQGEGEPLSACVFQDGLVSGVTMLAYPTNGG